MSPPLETPKGTTPDADADTSGIVVAEGESGETDAPVKTEDELPVVLDASDPDVSLCIVMVLRCGC
jgi:hypothetical protein